MPNFGISTWPILTAMASDFDAEIMHVELKFPYKVIAIGITQWSPRKW